MKLPYSKPWIQIYLKTDPCIEKPTLGRLHADWGVHAEIKLIALTKIAYNENPKSS